MTHRHVILRPIAERINKVSLGQFAKPIKPGDDDLLSIFPPLLAGHDLRLFLDAVREARHKEKPIIMMMGAHVLKVGLGPLIIQLIEEGYITHIATNGAGSIHDYEIALIGATSEDVATNLEDGCFGNWQETSQINDIIRDAAKKNLGYGQAIGQAILDANMPYKQYSVFAGAVAHNIPITVHSALGTEITHQHPNADGAAIGQTSLKDFHILVDTLKQLDGGVVTNWGSSVIMPEVFLKALTVARNLGATAKVFTSANFDMIKHYRPSVNVVERPTKHGGQGFQFVGQHEILLPLMTYLLLNHETHA